MDAKRKAAVKQAKAVTPLAPTAYGDLVGGIAGVVEAARRTSARAVNAAMTATCWEIGRRIVEYEQGGRERAEYGEAVLVRLSDDLTSRYGRSFGVVNLSQMKRFYLLWPKTPILQTPSEKSSSAGQSTTRSRTSGESGTELVQTPSAESTLAQIAAYFPLPWSAYVRLLAVKNEHARSFYETEGLRDEYSETDLEAALIQHLETFLMELGSDFCFVGCQRRLRISDEWYRVDLVFYHRRLRCLVLIDLKLGRFTHADAGQMYTYLAYAAEHWTHAGENPPVGLILCARKDEALARYALGNLPNTVLDTDTKRPIDTAWETPLSTCSRCGEVRRRRKELRHRPVFLPPVEGEPPGKWHD